MSDAGIYVIHILDPETEHIVIQSIDRLFAENAEHAIEQFKISFGWTSNWLIKAKPTWLEEKPPNNKNEQQNHQARHTAGFLRRRQSHGNIHQPGA